MKAIVLEIKNGEAAVLREDGVVVLTRQKCRVGETIELDERQRISGVRRFNRILRLAAVAMLVICIAGGTLGYMTVSASSYVSVDAGDTSLEFAVNRFGRVVSVEGLDEVSEEFARTILPDIKNKKFDAAMDHAMNCLEERGSIEGGGLDPIIAGVTAGSEKQKAELKAGIEHFANREDRPAPKFYTMEVSPQERLEAKEQKQSPGMFVFEQREDWDEEDWEDFFEEMEECEHPPLGPGGQGPQPPGFDGPHGPHGPRPPQGPPPQGLEEPDDLDDPDDMDDLNAPEEPDDPDDPDDLNDTEEPDDPDDLNDPEEPDDPDDPDEPEND